MSFSKQLIYWYLQLERDLPWRKSTNPYFIWLSEIILQQTRVSQGMSYYLAFTETFPTVNDLANASEAQVLKLWQGLGYYSRARNLHYSAQMIMTQFNGNFPTTYEDIIKLKGVGDYTASAISSICFDEPHAVVDGNVYRVLARYFGIDTPINSSKGIKEFKALAQTLLDPSQPGNHNQALMDFGAIQCKPQNPLCESCPLRNSCVALKENTVAQLPVKEKKIRVTKRFFNYLVIISDHHQTIFNERTGQGIWKGLYQFPLFETNTSINIEALEEASPYLEWCNLPVEISLFNEKEIVHKLSHQHLYTKFWIVKTNQLKKESIDWKNLTKFPAPILIANFLKNYAPSNR